MTFFEVKQFLKNQKKFKFYIFYFDFPSHFFYRSELIFLGLSVTKFNLSTTMEGNQKISDTTQQPFQLQPTEADYIAKASNCRFPGLVHKMLDSADPSIVSWIEHGEAFIIKDLVRAHIKVI